jgi:hypothetical protein
MRRMPKRIASGIIVAMMSACVGTAVAEPSVAHTDLELRGGVNYLCGSCNAYYFRTVIQLFADRLFPVTRMGDGVLEIGPYVKGALLNGGDVPQIAGGAIVGYRFGAYEVLVNVGRAYATELIGVNASPNSGQSRQTYDLGFSLRYDIHQYYFSVGYGHNSNGQSLGLNFNKAQGSNPGIDSILVGVGIHF